MKFNLKNLIDKGIFKKINYYINQNSIIGGGKYRASMCNYIPESIVLDYKKRIIVIGDIHGDFNSLLKCLYIAKVIDKNCKWIGNNTIVIQLGDQLDKGGRVNLSVDTINDELEELKVIEFMHYLHFEAKKKNGAVYNLLGNHELMNILGDFRYATSNHIKGFGGDKTRKELFKPGGAIAIKLACNTNGIMQIGNWIFVHAGLLPHHVKKFSITDINNKIRNILLGNITKDNAGPEMDDILYGPDGILWNRFYTKNKNNCKILNETFQILKLHKGHMVVGHTIQDKINSICNDKLWFADIGMSSAFGDNTNSNVEILEIKNNKDVKILRY